MIKYFLWNTLFFRLSLFIFISVPCAIFFNTWQVAGQVYICYTEMGSFFIITFPIEKIEPYITIENIFPTLRIFM